MIADDLHRLLLAHQDADHAVLAVPELPSHPPFNPALLAAAFVQRLPGKSKFCTDLKSTSSSSSCVLTSTSSNWTKA